ncbi:MAG TPA: hypothetical protein VFJ78_09600 [Gaiellaceae bacterium]|nr:hypothetical protein [Gaiellaceae bacterium]
MDAGIRTPSSAAPIDAVRGRLAAAAGRAWSALLAVWGGVTGLAPHVLHHVGPLAGAALLAGAGGRLLFAAIGFVAAIPFLLRLQRRFASWKAPAIALAVFVAMFSLSSFVIGPAITGSGGSDKPGIEQQGGHAGHHQK